MFHPMRQMGGAEQQHAIEPAALPATCGQCTYRDGRDLAACEWCRSLAGEFHADSDC
jgi:hypothetical protein